MKANIWQHIDRADPLWLEWKQKQYLQGRTGLDLVLDFGVTRVKIPYTLKAYSSDYVFDAVNLSDPVMRQGEFRVVSHILRTNAQLLETILAGESFELELSHQTSDGEPKPEKGSYSLLDVRLRDIADDKITTAYNAFAREYCSYQLVKKVTGKQGLVLICSDEDAFSAYFLVEKKGVDLPGSEATAAMFWPPRSLIQSDELIVFNPEYIDALQQLFDEVNSKYGWHVNVRLAELRTTAVQNQ